MFRTEHLHMLGVTVKLFRCHGDLPSKVFAPLNPKYAQWCSEHSRKTSVSLSDLQDKIFTRNPPNIKYILQVCTVHQ